MSKKEDILELFEANPGGLSVKEVAAQVGCTTTRVYEVIKSTEGGLQKLAPGFFGLDPDGDLSATITTGGAERPKRARPVEDLREELVKGVEVSILGEARGERFRFSRVGRNAATGAEWLEVHDADGRARSFYIDRLLTVHADVQMPEPPPQAKAPGRKAGTR